MRCKGVRCQRWKWRCHRRYPQVLYMRMSTTLASRRRHQPTSDLQVQILPIEPRSIRTAVRTPIPMPDCCPLGKQYGASVCTTAAGRATDSLSDPQRPTHPATACARLGRSTARIARDSSTIRASALSLETRAAAAGHQTPPTSALHASATLGPTSEPLAHSPTSPATPPAQNSNCHLPTPRRARRKSNRRLSRWMEIGIA